LAPKVVISFEKIKNISKEKDKIKITVDMEDEAEKKFTFSTFKDIDDVINYLKNKA